MGSDAELEGAYRLMNNEAVTFRALGGAHAEATQQRAEASGRVVVIHDTTTCEFSHADAEAIGYLPTGKAGFFFHASLVIEQRHWRRPLGVIQGEVVVRKQRSGRGSRAQAATGAQTAKWKDRESQRWWRGVKVANDRLKNCQSVLHITDREGDSYELLGTMAQNHFHFIIRAAHDRKARDPEALSEQWSWLKDLVKSTEGEIERDVPLSTRKPHTAPRTNESHPPRKARVARLRFKATSVELRRPKYLHDPLPPALKVNVVHVVEPNPPPEQEPVEWLLFTTESVDTSQQVEAIVDWYRHRWVIEEFNKALKTGCRYELRQFQSRDALLTMLALCLPIACELLWLRSRTRDAPSASAIDVLTPLQLRILRSLGPMKLTLDPSAKDALLAVAALGGHQRNNGDPGWQVLYRGMRKLMDYEVGWRAAASETCDQS
jgi:hypothetical protein